MVINREFFVRGWLPAGLVINARLLTTTAAGSAMAVMKPVINPSPNSAWTTDQVQLVFPVEQATSDTAIVLVDPFEDGALALLPLGRWFGSGTPYILATNTWYEGRVRAVSGADVMSIRIDAQVSPKYYSRNSGLPAKDVSIRAMACHLIPGRRTQRALLLDDRSLTTTDLGYAPRVLVEDKSVTARLMDVVLMSGVSFAGMRTAYTEPDGGQFAHFIQCELTAGKLASQDPTYVGIIPNGRYGSPNLYYLRQDKIVDIAGDMTSVDMYVGAVSIGSGAEDQVVHYN